jgi:hypothetical protein
MEMTRNIIICCLLVLGLSVLSGCGKKADENKPIAEVEAEAEKMSEKDLRATAMLYKDAITARKGELEELGAKFKDIPTTEMLGEKAKKLQGELDSVGKSLSALTERHEIYYNKLKEKGGDVSGLEI